MSSASVVRLRAAVRECCADIEPGQVVLVACSGGADSLALAGAAAWVGSRDGWAPVAVVVDHGLQTGSAEVAAWAARTCERLGVAAAHVVRVDVGGPGGPEAAARDARLAAIARMVDELGAVAVLLGHTRDDQAETVLLRLARGSGARSLAAMATTSGRLRRPFLAVPRVEVRTAALEMLEPLGELPWDDPHNDDPRFARVRVRQSLSTLEEALGGAVVAGLARTAHLLRDDADALDVIALDAEGRLVTIDGDGARSVDCASLAALPRAVRTRVIRSMCLAAGSAGEDLDLEHVVAVERLVSAWTGQGPIALPGRVRAMRAYGRLRVHPGTDFGDDVAS